MPRPPGEAQPSLRNRRRRRRDSQFQQLSRHRLSPLFAGAATIRFTGMTPDSERYELHRQYRARRQNRYDSLPAGTNCFSSLTVGSNNDPLTVTGKCSGRFTSTAAMSIPGDFKCTELHDRAHQQDTPQPDRQCHGQRRGERSTSPRPRAGLQGHCDLPGPPRVELNELQPDQRQLGRRSSPAPCISRTRSCSTTGLETQLPCARCSSPSGSRSPATAHENKFKSLRLRRTEGAIRRVRPDGRLSEDESKPANRLRTTSTARRSSSSPSLHRSSG